MHSNRDTTRNSSPCKQRTRCWRAHTDTHMDVISLFVWLHSECSCCCLHKDKHQPRASKYCICTTCHTHTHTERNMPDSYMKTHVVGLAVLQGKHWCYVRTLLTDWRCLVTWAPAWGPTGRKQRIKLLRGPARLWESHYPPHPRPHARRTQDHKQHLKKGVWWSRLQRKWIEIIPKLRTGSRKNN